MFMKWIVSVVSLLVIGALVAVLIQHFRYINVRRDVVNDRQAVFYPSDTFHVVTVLKLRSDQDLLVGVKELVDAIEADGAQVIYAGKIVVNALQSKQIPKEDWDAFVLAQYPSREAYDATSSESDDVAVRDSFANTYSLGMRRSAPLNLGFPIMLLGMRVADILTGQPSPYPFTRAEANDDTPIEALRQRSRMVAGLLANREYGKDACVVLNFIKAGDADEQAANQGYGSAMMRLMAEGGHGPMHIGPAVTLEGDADFDQVVIVYYPGVEYFADLIQSEFFAGIVGGKQLGDSLSSPSVPLLPHL